ncbi:MAG: heme o synthase [Anaerolineales bacterium]|nr:heme o synthase [Anaerolineales bacterium]MCW5838657.1 heme o synthase [Anaerolineales bacterium]
MSPTKQKAVKKSSRRKTSAPIAIGNFRYLVLAATIATFLLIVIGGIVRVTGSGLGCPDWPTCFGRILPPPQIEAQIEFSHRFWASAVTSPLILLSAFFAWRRFRSVRLIWLPLFWSLPILAIQAALGAVVVLQELPPYIVAVHLGTAFLLLALLILATVTAFRLHLKSASAERLVFQSRFARLALGGLIGLFIVLVSGAFTAAGGATYACSGWPLCNGELIPSHALGWLHMFHRSMVALLTVHMLLLLRAAWRSQRSQRGILSAATLTVVLYFAQILVGALKVSFQFPIYLLGLHVATAAAVWALMVVLVVLVGLAGRTTKDEQREAAQPTNPKQRLVDFFLLTKPVIVALLLVTTYAGMVVAGKALPSLSLTFWTMLGGALAAGGSGAINQYLDREIDQHMTRTARRPIAAGRLTPAEGYAFGLGALVISFYIMAGFVNLLAALLSLAGMIYYIVLYSMWLKHVTVQNIVIGGGAGAIPPLVGWAAVSGNLSVPALFMFAIVFMWTPPHFWALALVKQNDYARAGVPMLPVVRGAKNTRWQIWLYTLELVALTLLMPVLGMAGGVYAVCAALLGAWLIYWAWKVWKVGSNKIAWSMYRYSSMYLAFLFVALVVDALL